VGRELLRDSLGGDRHDPLGPDLLAARRIEGHDRLHPVRDEQLAVVETRTVGPHVVRVVSLLPHELPGAKIDGVDVALEVLQVHGPVHDERAGSERSERGGAFDPVRPADAQLIHVLG
jgi:hypothetical protein